jgi:hypothetical protein
MTIIAIRKSFVSEKKGPGMKCDGPGSPFTKRDTILKARYNVARCQQYP